MKRKKKHTLYFIGGLERVGKTTVLDGLMEKNHLLVFQTDAIRAAVRKVLVGEADVWVEKMRISVKGEFRRPGNLKHVPFKNIQDKKSADDLAWEAILGLIEAYDKKDKADMIVEGIAVTPERVHALALKNLRLRAAFIGFGSESHFDAVLAYAKKKKDWVYLSIKERKGKTDHVTDWVRNGIKKSKKLEKRAKKFGYGYFDVTELPFKKHVAAVLSYLSKK